MTAQIADTLNSFTYKSNLEPQVEMAQIWFFEGGKKKKKKERLELGHLDCHEKVTYGFHVDKKNFHIFVNCIFLLC